MTYWDNKKILVTGGAGFLGSFLVEKLRGRGVREENIRIPRSKATDLRRWENCVRTVKDMDIVIHLAARVGGIGYNEAYPASLFFDNAIMGIQMMEAARQEAVKKFVAVGTVCAYPKFTRVPFREEELWNGYPEETNAPYGLAKKMLLVQSQAYRQQYGFNAIFLLPVNLYGPGDINPQNNPINPPIKPITNASAKNIRCICPLESPFVESNPISRLLRLNETSETVEPKYQATKNTGSETINKFIMMVSEKPNSKSVKVLPRLFWM